MQFIRLNIIYGCLTPGIQNYLNFVYRKDQTEMNNNNKKISFKLLNKMS